MPGFSGHGAKFWVQQGSGSFYRVGRIMDVSGPSLSTADVDITTNDSPAHVKEYIASLIGGGEVTFPTLIDVERFGTLRGYQTAQSTLSVALLLPSVPQVLVTCDGYIKGLDNSVPMEEAIQSDVTVMVTNVVNILPQPVGPLTLTPEQGTDNTPSPGTDLSAQLGFRTDEDANPTPGRTDGFGTLTVDDGGLQGTPVVVRLYHTTNSANQGIHLKIDNFEPAGSDEFYLRLGDELLYRAGQSGGARTADPQGDDYIYRWGGAAYASSPFTADTAIAVQVFAE